MIVHDLIGLCSKTYVEGIESDKILQRLVLFCCFLEGLMLNIFFIKIVFFKNSISLKKINSFLNPTFL